MPSLQLILLLALLALSTSFITPTLPSPSLALSARGFKDLKYGSSNSSPTPADALTPPDRQSLWASSYKSHLSSHGATLTTLAYSGHLKSGRGAVLTKITQNSPHAFLPRKEWTSNVVLSPDDSLNLEEITDRIGRYDEQRSFVVVFEAHGIMGCDIVTPKESIKVIAEREIARRDGVINL